MEHEVVVCFVSVAAVVVVVIEDSCKQVYNNNCATHTHTHTHTRKYISL